MIGKDARQNVLRPSDVQLVRARDPLLGRELAARVRGDRAPTELLGRPAKRFRGVDRAEHQEPRRRTEDVREDLVARELDLLRVRAAKQLVRHRILALERDPLRPVLEIREDDRAVFVGAFVKLAVILAHEHVDLAAARQPDLECLLVRDSVRKELRLCPTQHRLAGLVNIRLDAAAADAAAHLAGLRHDQLGADRPRC